MLPDFIEEKVLVKRTLTEYLRNRTRTLMGVFGRVRRYHDHEGGRQRLIRADGSVAESAYKEVSAQLSLDLNEVLGITEDEFRAKLEQLANDMARQASLHAIETINEAVETVGNVISARGKPLNPDMILEALEKMEVDFDRKGEPILPTIMVGPDLGVKLKEQIPKWYQEYPHFERRLNEILEIKRMMWRDREASRKLVD